MRSLEGDTVLRNRLRDNATAVGMDWSHSWSNRVYRWRGTLMASDVHGSRQAMALTQRSPTHYFQRPDREVTSDGLFSTRELRALPGVRRAAHEREAGVRARHRGHHAGAATGQYTVDPDGAGPAAAFSFGDPNFTTRSLRGTAVLRWEYRPGSTMFFVWTQQRSGFEQFGDLDFRRDARALLGDRPDNVFLVKATYWLGR